ncbi:MAG: radical SAM protein, partial [Elusimicrobia bacterium]|nr:radical SAM protein [Elusimicrobiota bacterium]
VLTGIRLGSYGLSSSSGRVGKTRGNFLALLQNLIQIPGKFRIRLSSLEITELTDELISLARSSDTICRNFHLPLQSGDDSVLKRMGRWYTSAFFSERVGRLRDQIPDVGLTTDVIVGFPGENEENFQNTVRFLRTHFDGLHVFPFSSRPGTSAEKLPQPNSAGSIRKRTRTLLDLDQDIRRRFQERFAGQKRLVLAESDGGFTDNGIWLSSPLPFSNGTMDWLEVPPVSNN